MARRLVWIACALVLAGPGVSRSAVARPLGQVLVRARCLRQQVGEFNWLDASGSSGSGSGSATVPASGAAPASATSAASDPDAAFAPEVFIEAISVRGNTITAERLIRRALAVRPGDCLRTDNALLRAARYKVLALGYFRDVDLRFEKGTQRGSVVLVVEVVERGTLVLNRMFFGTSQTSPWWAGLDFGDRNVLGLGVALSGAFVFAGAGDAAGARAQRAFALRIDDPSLLGSAIGWHTAFHYVDASEPYRVRGDFADSAPINFAAFDYRRLGGRGGVTIDVTPLARLSIDVRGETVHAVLPVDPRQQLPDGTSAPIDLYLRDGNSRVVTALVGLDRDSRPDPVLPYAGTHIALQAEVALPPLSSYGFATLFARYEHWIQVAERHVVSFHLTVGAVLGDAPRFDRLYVGDLDRMLAPRALGLVMSSTAALDVFGTGANRLTYGDLGGAAEVQYAYRLFRGRGHIYGGDLFVGAGLWSLAQRSTLADSAPAVDILLDAGLRLDSELGIFELSLANGLGRLPL